MREHHRLTRTPILVIDLGSVLGLDRWHRNTPALRRHSGTRVNPQVENQIETSAQARPGMPNPAQASAAVGRNRRDAPTITMTKNSSTRPWITAKGGSLGGTLGASACSAGILRKPWIT